MLMNGQVVFSNDSLINAQVDGSAAPVKLRSQQLCEEAGGSFSRSRTAPVISGLI